MNYVEDEHGNRATIARWGSEEEAREALRSCTDCTYCTDCTDCTYCTDCTDCTGCTYCTDCTGCRRCSDCTYCTDCTDCTDCRRCTDCTDCTYCTDCTGCRRCSDCTYCTDCTDCTDCTGCRRCTDCSDCSDCSDKEESHDVPVIPDIHRKVYEAAIQPNALCMKSWHTCETTHCRAGWVVVLAGEAGLALEEKTSTLFAAQQIYRASGYEISPCRFFDGEEDALADMKRLAEKEAT